MRKFLAGLMLVCSAAQAQYQTGNNLYSDITNRSDAVQLFAMGYIVGVTDAFIGKELCVPKDVTQGQLVEVVSNFLASRPQIRHQPADILILVALSQHWACPSGRKKS